jgi:cytoskeletal protein CcmA (bactofilin family)
MLGKKKQPSIRSLVGEGTSVQGEVRFTEGLRIDGDVCGDVIAVGDAASLVVISEKARVTGRVVGGHVIINGTGHGPVTSAQLLELQPKAVIVGDVRYEVLEMHQGATIHGELRPNKSAERPGLKLAASKAG